MTKIIIKQYFIPFLFLICSFHETKAQDSDFSQNLCTRTYLNPAIVGTDSTLVVSSAFRINDITFDNNIRLALDQYVPFLKGGVGVEVMNQYDDSYNSNTSNVNLSYAPHFELFHHQLTIQPGFSGAYFKHSYSYFDGTNTTYSYADLNSGVFMYTNKIYGGIALKHLTHADDLPYHLTINAGGNFSKAANSDFVISPNLVFQKEIGHSELQLGITSKLKWFILGLNYRTGDAVILNLGFQNRFLKVGYSFDFRGETNDSYYAYTYSHELQLMFFVHYQKKPCKIKTIRFI